jgi:lysophospholipase L1-like esterase
MVRMRFGLLILALSSGVLAEVAAPTFARLVDGRVTLTSATAGAVVRYSFEAKDPDKSAGVYLAPVLIPFGRTLRARAFSADGAEQSETILVEAQALPSTLVEVTQNRDWKNYDWVKRHEAIIALGKARQPELLLIGDSITHFWGGEPADARLRGAEVWDKYFGARKALNLGYGWDRTENVLWRLRHGEIDGLAPKAVVLMIGTNNAMINTAEEIAAGIEAICIELHMRLPGAKILLLGIFPRGVKPDAARAKTIAVNELIATLDGKHAVTYLNVGHVFLGQDGTIAPEIMNDYLHPTAAGYEKWAAAMEPTLERLLSNR